ncbi:hypothetical protein ILUMI_25014, partial [Ignelater luminosus]
FHDDDEESGEPHPPNFYLEYTTSPYTSVNPYYTTPQPYTTKSVNYYSISTTKSYFNFQNYGSQSTTKSPYSFQSYQRQETTPQNVYNNQQQQHTTKNPYIGDYYRLRKLTTKNPYDFASFAKGFQDINNNYLKRSYNVASYYDSSNVRNRTTNFNTQTATR